MTRVDAEILPHSLTLAFLDSDLDYRRAAVESQYLTGESRRDSLLDLACAMDQAKAGERAGIMLREAWAAGQA